MTDGLVVRVALPVVAVLFRIVIAVVLTYTSSSSSSSSSPGRY